LSGWIVVLLVAVVAWLAWAWQREVRLHEDLRATIPDLERSAREHSLKTSSGTRLGQIAEQFVPFLADFPFDPRDAQFLGRPIDFIVFDGLFEGQIERVVFVEVKSGRRKTLDPRQRAVRECIEQGRVEFRLLALEGSSLVGPD
jgi:predicted Holliday junction resolvase-like endonuclease